MKQKPNLSKSFRIIKEYIKTIIDRFSKFRFVSSNKNLDRKLISKLNRNKIPRGGQFKHLFRVLTKTEKKVFTFFSAVLIISLFLLIYSAFFKDVQLAPKIGGEYTEGLVGSPLYINPLFASSNDVDQDLSRLIYNGLVRYDKNYQIIPDLAESWKISEDQKSYTFKIRKNVKWHDGEPFTVNDVFFTFQLLKDKEVKSPLSTTFAGVDAEITAENEITFKLQEPYIGFLNIMTVGILPQHIWFDVPSANMQLARYNQKPIGTGPFKFKSLLKEKNGNIVSYTFEANKNYHLTRPYLNRINFKFYLNSMEAVEALKNKNVQGLGFLPKEYLPEISKRNINIHNINLSQFTAVFLNKSKNKLLADKNIKLALKLSTNKERILDEVLQKQGVIIHSPILPGYLGFNDLIIDEYNPVKAAEILTADGWALREVAIDRDGAVIDETKTSSDSSEKTNDATNSKPLENVDVLVKNDQALLIELTTVDQPDSVKLVKLLKENWEQIGIKVNINIVEKNIFSKDTLPNRDYQALAYGGIIGYDVDPFPFWHSSQREFPGVNLSNYVNRKADTIIEDARQTSDIEVREEKYREFQKIIAEDSPAIFLYSPTYSYPVSTEIKGIQIPRMNRPSDRFWNVTQWYTKTKRLLK